MSGHLRMPALDTGGPASTGAGVADQLAAAVRLPVLTVEVDLVLLGGGVADVGEPLRVAVSQALTRQSLRAPFLRALDVPTRIRLVGGDHPVAAFGAAMLGQGPPA